MTADLVREVQTASLIALTLLLGYTLWLWRYRGLDRNLAFRWIVLQCGTILALALLSIPAIRKLVSHLRETELLLILAVLTFAFVAFLIFDLLLKISRQSVQIEVLSQELALRRSGSDPEAARDLPSESGEQDRAARWERSLASFRPSLRSAGPQLLFFLWLLGVALLNGILLNEPLMREWADSAGLLSYEAVLKPRFTAAYLH
jgi:hypothetical protein